MGDLQNTYFNDYEAFSENEIVKITKNGISLKNGMFIDFSDCAKNFKKVNHGSNGKCIGEREITDFSFTFYASPKPIVIKFLPRNKLAEFFAKINTQKRFHEFQRKINTFGFSTYDIT